MLQMLIFPKYICNVLIYILKKIRKITKALNEIIMK